MTLKEACEKEWISDMTLRTWRYENPKIGEYFNAMKIARKDMIHHMMEEAAMQNVMEGIGGGVKLRPLDKINISLRYLEKTSPEFNPSLKLDVDSTTNVQISMGSEEMQQRAMELATALWITNLQSYEQRNILPTTVSSNTNEEQVGDWENAEA